MAVSYSYVRGVSTCGSAISGEGSCAVGMRERVERLGRRAAEALSHSTPPPRRRLVLVSVVHNVEVRDLLAQLLLRCSEVSQPVRLRRVRTLRCCRPASDIELHPARWSSVSVVRPATARSPSSKTRPVRSRWVRDGIPATARNLT